MVGGGVAFIAALAGLAAASSFGPLLAAFVLFFPASGAFVSLTQAALMDAAPGRRGQLMAGWNLAGSLGAVTGPLLLAAVLAAGGSWRTAFGVLAALAGVALAVTAVTGPSRVRHGPAGPDGTARSGGHPEVDGASRQRGTSAPGTGSGSEPGRPAAGGGDQPGRLAGGGDEPGKSAAAQVLGALRDTTVLRWLLLLQVSDLLLDVLSAFIGVYLVDAAGATPAQAALGVAVRLGAGLAGDAALVIILRRFGSRPAVLAATCAAAVLFPAFLLVPGTAAKLVLLAAVSIATSAWYPVLQAGLYSSLPGRSGVAVSLTSAASLLGAVGTLAIGFAAQRIGLGGALGVLAAAPLIILAALPGRARNLA